MKDVHHVELGQWPPVMYVITTKPAYYAFWRKHCGGHERMPYPLPDGAHCQKLVNGKTGDCMFVIVLGQQCNRDELAVSLAHEATHAMRWLLEHVGEHSPGLETQAYLVEHIVKSGLKAIQ